MGQSCSNMQKNGCIQGSTLISVGELMSLGDPDCYKAGEGVGRIRSWVPLYILLLSPQRRLCDSQR